MLEYTSFCISTRPETAIAIADDAKFATIGVQVQIERDTHTQVFTVPAVPDFFFFESFAALASFADLKLKPLDFFWSANRAR